MTPQAIHTSPNRESVTIFTNDSEPIWDLPGLVKDQFYGAAYFLSHHQRQQINDDYPRRSTTPLETKNLLDALALLFARAKGKGTDTAANVTAVAMEEKTQGPTLTFAFHIAKNGGPQNVGGLSDRQLAHDLVKWFNKGQELEPRPDTGMWPTLVNFWIQRVETYLNGIEQSKKLVVSELMQQYQETGKADLVAFADDFETLTQYRAVQEATIVSRIHKMCFELADVSDHKYPKYPTPKKGQKDTRLNRQKGAEKFRKAIKHIKLLRNLRVVWDSFRALREQNPNAVIDIAFLSPQKPFELEIEPILASMSRWKPPFNGNQTFKTDTDAVAEILKKQGPVRERYFHCELQLLEFCITSSTSSSFNSFQDYFGCSKLSCYLCWQVMKGADYQTKGTHSRLYPDCAFPFGISSVDGHCILASSLKLVQNQLLERILTYYMHPEDTLTQGPAQTETNPYAATVVHEVDVEGQIADWSTPHDKAGRTTKMQLPVLKLSANGEWAVEDMTLYRINPKRQPRYQLGGFFYPNAEWHPAGARKNELWISDIQGRYLEQFGLRWKSRVSLNLDPEWQWTTFELMLDGGEKTCAEVQILCRLADDRQHRLPVNSHCEQAVGYNLDYADNFPWRGDLYLTGRVVVLNALGERRELRSMSEEHALEFLEIFREMVRWITQNDLASRKKIYDYLHTGNQWRTQKADLTRMHNEPSEQFKKEQRNQSSISIKFKAGIERNVENFLDTEIGQQVASFARKVAYLGHGTEHHGRRLNGRPWSYYLENHSS